MSAEVRPDVDLEELLDNEIPCGGNLDSSAARTCHNAAVLRRHMHAGCPDPEDAYCFKCITCWQVWFSAVMRDIAAAGAIHCRHCMQGFNSVESFADYRPF